MLTDIDTQIKGFLAPLIFLPNSIFISFFLHHVS